MGTFIIKPTISAHQQSGVWANYNSGFWNARSDADCLTAINGDFSNPNDYLGCGKLAIGDPSALTEQLIRFAFSTGSSIISLDGDPPISFFGLPVGFTPTSASVKIGSHGGGVDVGTKLYIQFNPLTEKEYILAIATVGITVYNAPYDFTPPFEPNMLDIINNGYGIRVLFTGANNFLSFTNAYISGTYEIAQSMIFTTEIPEEPVKTGDTIKVTSPVQDPIIDSLDFTQIETITMHYIDSAGIDQYVDIPPLLWQDITFYTLTFTWPNIPEDADIVDATITSTQFSGSISLGSFITIYFRNAPGIYRIVRGKISDTLYRVRTNETIEVKIPNPRARTGFIGG